ncbi:MAG TPA: STAS domain-containing protein [Solimonas sp.]|nr:STAS domain-containing protein [Solimonas sp.]
MTFRVAEEAESSTVFLDGEIDLERSPEAREVLLEVLGKGRPLRVDLSEVSYMDSSGIASLVEAHQKARNAKLGFSLVRVSAAVMKVLTLARLDQVFSIEGAA